MRDFVYNASTGVVTLNGLPATLAAGATIGPLTITYAQPASGTSTITAGATTTSPNLNPVTTVSATIGGNPVATVTSSLAGFPASVNAGQPVSGTVTFGNQGPSTAVGLSYTLSLPANLTASPTLTGLPVGATFSYAPATGLMTLTGMPATLASGANLGPYTLGYVQPGLGASTVTATFRTTTVDPNPNLGVATVSIAGNAVATVTSSLAAFPASINAGQPVSGTVMFGNQGPSTAAGVNFTLTLPANLAASPTLAGLPVGATFSYAPGTGVVTLAGMPATLAPGASLGPFTLGYVQPPSGTSTVIATVTTATIDPNPGLGIATVTVAGNPVATVTSSLAGFPASVNAGQPASGTVAFGNQGPSTALGLTYTLTLPANLSTAPTLSGLPVGVTYSYVAATGVVNFVGLPATLASGANLGPFTLSYLQPPLGSSTVTATIRTTTVDPNPNQGVASVTIGGNAVATVTSTAAFPATVNAGHPVSGTLTFANQGPSTAAGLTYALMLPAHLAVAPTLSGLPAGATYSYVAATGGVALLSMPATLASGASIGPITVGYLQPPTGTSTVTATFATTTLDPTPNLGTVSVTINGVAVATVISSATFPPSANAGQPVSGTVSFGNQGPSTAAGMTYALSLPANLATAPTISGLPVGATYSYSATTGAVTILGLPATLASGATVGPIGVLYTQPATGHSSVTVTATTTTLNPTPAAGIVMATIGGMPVASVTSTLSAPPTVNAGLPVNVTLGYHNLGPSSASSTSFSLTLPAKLPATPTIAGLPTGASYSYDPTSGVVTFAGMPSTLAAGASLGPISINYVQPVSGHSTVTSTFTTSTLVSNPGGGTSTVTINGAAAEVTGVVFTDLNQTGTYQPGDSPVVGATVELKSGSSVVASVVTNASGYYSFAGQHAGSYTVETVPGAGRLATTPTTVAVTLPTNSPRAINFGQIPASAVGALVVTKTTPLVNIVAGQSVPYTITVTNSQKQSLSSVTLTDLAPAGFRYRSGSGSVNGKRQDPAVSGRDLSWTRLSFAANEKKTFTLVLTAGAGITSGEFTNTASAFNGLTGTLISNVASATVRLSGDPTFDCPDLIGRVFDDKNANGRQDDGEPGIAGVRVVTAQGLLVTTDDQGRYHIACPILPDATVGTNFIVKLDERTLPSGYRLTTENPETVRLTAGKVSKLNFGATIHHVVRIELSDSAFEQDAVRDFVVAQLEQVVEAQKGEAVIIRLGYQAHSEGDSVIGRRLKAVRETLEALWQAKQCRYPLKTEQDIVRSIGPGTAGDGVSP